MSGAVVATRKSREDPGTPRTPSRGEGQGALALVNLLARGTGMAREIVVSSVFGAGATMDAYQAALRVPQLVRELLAEGSLQNTLVPGLAHAQAEGGDDEAWSLADALLGVLLAVLGVVTLGFLVGAPWLVPVVAAGFVGEKQALAVSLTRWLSPFMAGLSLAALASGALNARGRFLGPAVAANALNLVVLLGALAAPWLGARTGLAPIAVLALATSLSGFVQLAMVIPQLRRAGWRPRPHLRGHPRLRTVLTTLGPALVGVATVQLNLLIETQWAASLGDGPLSWLVLGFRLVQIPLAVVAGSVATVALSGVAGSLARGDTRGAGDQLAQALATNALGVVPCAVALGVLADPLCSFLFERGAFDHAATVGTADMLRGYSWATFGICLHRVLVPSYYALGRPRLPAVLGVGALVLKIPVTWALLRWTSLGAVALPIGHAVTVTAEVAVLLALLAPDLRGRGLVGQHLRVGVAALALGVVAWLLRDRLHVVLVCAAAGSAYVVVGALLGLRWPRAAPANPLPPGADPALAAALDALARGEAALVGKRVVGRDAVWELGARGGALVLARVANAGAEGGADRLPVHGDRTPSPGPRVEALLRPGRPPVVAGLAVGAVAWHAVGDELRAGDGATVRLPWTPRG
jgi:putative peptidoglycan lipid II flippase